MDDEHLSESTDDTPAHGDRPARRRLPLALALGAVAVLAAAAALLWWAPWDGGPECVEDRAHVVDDEAGLCYAIPEGWEPTSSERLGEFYTSGVVPESADDHSWIGVIRVEDLDGSVDGNDPEAAARTIAVGLATTYEDDEPEVVSRSWELGRREAATATAAGDRFPVTFQVTVVDLDGGPVALISSTVGRFIDGHEVLDPVHETLALR